MATPRETPYGAFNYLVNLGLPGAPEDKVLGGFSDVSGIGREVTVAEYRNGNEKELLPRKVAGMHKISDVTLKRGVVNSRMLWEWVNGINKEDPDTKGNVTITLRDEENEGVLSWTLQRVIPMKYTGPTLAAKGGGDVAMEELVLSVEGLDMQVL